MALDALAVMRFTADPVRAIGIAEATCHSNHRFVTSEQKLKLLKRMLRHVQQQKQDCLHDV
jgi:hypothetical protein